MGYKFHDEFEADVRRIRFLEKVCYLGAGAGFVFAATVVNPNYIKRRAWYLRKFSLFFFSCAGYSLGHRYYQD